MNELIEILNVEPQTKGHMIARFDVYIKPWDFEVLGMTYFEKGDNRWCSMPSRSWEKDGETKFQEIGRFRDPKRNRRFLDQVKSAFMAYKAKNPDLKPEPAIKATEEEIPF